MPWHHPRAKEVIRVDAAQTLSSPAIRGGFIDAIARLAGAPRRRV